MRRLVKRVAVMASPRGAEVAAFVSVILSVLSRFSVPPRQPAAFIHSEALSTRGRTMQPILHDLLSKWQDEPEADPEELCRDHPELLPLLREQIAILRRIEELAEAAAQDEE